MSITKINEGFTHAAPAAADLSAKLNFLASIDSAGKIALAGDGGPVAGVIIEGATLGNAATIAFGAVLKAVCATAITPGAVLASDADGKLVAAAVGDWICGIAVNTAASSAGDLVPFIALSSRRHA